ncbi:hypothetical protein [Paraferrimonas sp. SM1919]|uniref:hypothetical protein n=1 Tax=Paraferrimonas sp. SM1919 TaxID=2662263 RepID=UPI0013D0167C|nr:hypothetical protein [Paraferrimonas sp. SM1919]
MKHLVQIIAVLLIVSSQGALACSFAGSDLFKPTLERWQQHPGPAQRGEQGSYWEPVPAPVIKVISVTRGSTEPGTSCSDAGTLSLQISLPEQSTYSIEEFGFYFRLKSGTLPDAIFPDIPMVGVIEHGKSNILFAWLDGHPSQQIELDLEIEVFLVTNGLNVGPSSTFTVKTGKG